MRFTRRRRMDELPFAVDPRRINAVVGVIALMLPVALALAAIPARTPFMFSISHFYYTRVGGDILVGSLSVIGLILIFLYEYKGDDRPGNVAHNLWNTLLAKLAGVAALCVAFFPTRGVGFQYDGGQVSRFLVVDTVADGPVHTLSSDLPPNVTGTITEDFWGSFTGFDPTHGLFGWIAGLHYFGAAAMFLILGYFSVFVFTRVQTQAATTTRALDGPRTRVKTWRNRIYRIMGIVIFACVAALGIKSGMVEKWMAPDAARAFLAGWNGGHWTFTFESLALVAFGISWSVKGRLFGLFEDED